MAYDLVVRGGTLHTASTTVEADIGVRGGKVAGCAPVAVPPRGIFLKRAGCPGRGAS